MLCLCSRSWSRRTVSVGFIRMSQFLLIVCQLHWIEESLEGFGLKLTFSLVHLTVAQVMSVCECMCVHVCVCVSICTSLCKWMCACMLAHECTCMLVCVQHACMCNV